MTILDSFFILRLRTKHFDRKAKMVKQTHSFCIAATFAVCLILLLWMPSFNVQSYKQPTLESIGEKKSNFKAILDLLTQKSTFKKKPVLLTPLGSKEIKPLGKGTPNEDFELMWNYVYNRQYYCSESEYLGGTSHFGDGAYDLCVEEQFFPKSKDPTYKCLMYSIGTAYDFTFDDAMARKGCEVHSFDPSVNIKDGHVRKSGVTFHKVGISAQDNDKGYKGWKMRTLKTLIKELGHTGRYLDYLKVDTDKPGAGGFEDMVMAELLATGLYKCVRQYAMEMHMLTPLTNPVHLKRWQTVYKQITQLNEHGWRLYNTTNNVRYLLQKDPTITMRRQRDHFLKGASPSFLWEVAFVNFDVQQPCNV